MTKAQPKRVRWEPADNRVQTNAWIAEPLLKRARHMEVDKGWKHSELIAQALEEYLRKHGY